MGFVLWFLASSSSNDCVTLERLLVDLDVIPDCENPPLALATTSTRESRGKAKEGQRRSTIFEIFAFCSTAERRTDPGTESLVENHVEKSIRRPFLIERVDPSSRGRSWWIENR